MPQQEWYKPVFLSDQGAEEAGKRLQRKRAQAEQETDPEKRTQLEQYLRGAELDVAWQRELEASAKGRRPVYYNTGCCSFSSGSITGIVFLLLSHHDCEVKKKNG